MVDVPPLLDASAPESADCSHHWRIERPSGETSKGVCQICGASRDFLNYVYQPPSSRTRHGQTHVPPVASG